MLKSFRPGVSSGDGRCCESSWLIFLGISGGWPILNRVSISIEWFASNLYILLGMLCLSCLGGGVLEFDGGLMETLS